MPSSHQPALILATAASIAAGLVHAAASGSHAELATLSMLFAVTALAQIGWGAAALVRPTAPVIVAGIGIHLASLGAWAASRTVGIPPIEGLEGGQAIAFQDGLVAGLQAVAVLGAGLALTSMTWPRVARAAVPAVVAALAFTTVPAMAQPHDVGSHDHDDRHDTVAAEEPEVFAPTPVAEHVDPEGTPDHGH